MSNRIKLLFITGELLPRYNVAAEIMYTIASEMEKKYSCDVSVLGYSTSESNYFPEELNGFRTFWMPRPKRYYSIIREKSIASRLLKAIPHPKVFFFYFCNHFDQGFIKRIGYKKALNILLEKERFDCIISFCFPVEPLIALSRINSKIPYISYKLDPWSSHYLAKHGSEIKKEIKSDENASAIIVTKPIRDDYDSYNYPESIKNKLLILHFPNIFYKQCLEKNIYSHDYINCTFAGSLYSDIRNPEYTINLFSFFSDNRILLHLVGNTNGANITQTPNLKYHERVKPEEALSYMQEADILVNIGNTIINQMPSKILTYISLGKPILNIIKDPNCPTLPYMEKYPMALNILETQEPTEEDVARVRKFILKNKGKRIPFDTIKELYYDCTPEYVGGKVYETICKVIKERTGE